MPNTLASRGTGSGYGVPSTTIHGAVGLEVGTRTCFTPGMKFSISIAMSEPQQHVALARAAEEAGYHAMVLPDSIFYSEKVSAAYPYTPDGSRMWDATTPWVDPLVGAAAMAAATRQLFF